MYVARFAVATAGKSGRSHGLQSALANTNPSHDHDGNSFKSARRRMPSRMS
jgi:hypothetical protein